MKVTDKDLAMEKALIDKLDLMIDRCHNKKLDSPLLIDGYEGYGKSNMAAAVAYYVHYKTGRPLSLNNVFFDAESMVEFALKTDQQIIWWDEAALMGLSSDFQNKIQVALVKTLMVARKKRHFYIFNIPRFYRMREALIERCIGLIHVYARHEKEIGRFVYYKKNSLDTLYEQWKKTKRKPDYKFNYDLRGSFPEALPKVLDEEAYDAKKDKEMLAILNVLGEKKNPWHDKYKLLKQKIAKILIKKEWPIETPEEFCEKIDESLRTFENYRAGRQRPKEEATEGGGGLFSPPARSPYPNNGDMLGVITPAPNKSPEPIQSI